MKKIYKNIMASSLSSIFAEIKKVLLENEETDYNLILQDKEHQRSTEISTHFHSHITNIYSSLRDAGVKVTREQIYFECLLLACEMETAEGASPYPYVIIERQYNMGGDPRKAMKIPMLEPLRTTNRSNKQMMQAIEATHRYASVIVCEKYGLAEGLILPETEEE